MIDRFTLYKGVWSGRAYLEVGIDGEEQRYGRFRDHTLLPGDAFDASRFLTGTTYEKGAIGEFCDGVFTVGVTNTVDTAEGLCSLRFWYGDRSETFDFAPFGLGDDLATIRDRILERIAAVRAWVETVRVPDTEEYLEVVVPAGG